MPCSFSVTVSTDVSRTRDMSLATCGVSKCSLNMWEDLAVLAFLPVAPPDAARRVASLTYLPQTSVPSMVSNSKPCSSPVAGFCFASMAARQTRLLRVGKIGRAHV